MTVELGKPAPDFKLPATGGQTIQLSQLKGTRVVLYFYPKDNTPGCTQEGLDFAQYHAQFAKLNTLIFGISRDTLASHEKYKAKQNYPFALLSDTDEVACHDYGVIKEKLMFGKTLLGIERSTFLIDEKGILIDAWRKVKISGHVKAVYEAVKKAHKEGAQVAS